MKHNFQLQFYSPFTICSYGILTKMWKACQPVNQQWEMELKTKKINEVFKLVKLILQFNSDGPGVINFDAKNDALFVNLPEAEIVMDDNQPSDDGVENDTNENNQKGFWDLIFYFKARNLILIMVSRTGFFTQNYSNVEWLVGLKLNE